MKKTKGNDLYFIMLFIGTVLTLAGVDLARHLLVRAAPPPHSHVGLMPLTIMGFCVALFVTEKLGHFQLSLRLYLLAFFLIVAGLFYELQIGGWEAGLRQDTALVLILLPLLILMARYPFKVLRSEEERSNN